MGRRVLYHVEPGQRFGSWVIAADYSGGSSVPCICDCGTSQTVLKSNLRGGQSVSCGCGRLKYRFDRAYFHTIDSEQKAYWLGFIASDGYIQQRRGFGWIVVDLSAKDIGHLEALRAAIGDAPPIVMHAGNNSALVKNASTKQYARLTLASSAMASDMIRLGITPRKDSRAGLPPIARALLRHFIRGVFDADGSLTMTSGFRIVGWPATISAYRALIVEAVGLNCTKIIPNGAVCALAWTGRDQARRLGEWLYRDATVYLERKHARFTQLCGPVGGDAREPRNHTK